MRSLSSLSSDRHSPFMDTPSTERFEHRLSMRRFLLTLSRWLKPLHARSPGQTEEPSFGNKDIVNIAIPDKRVDLVKDAWLSDVDSGLVAQLGQGPCKHMMISINV